MAGFIRRYPFYPGTDLITQIEGVIIADLPPPGSIAGRGVGTACIVGECADMTYATVQAAGVVSTKTQPVEVFSAIDMVNKVGGFDETLGEFGVSLGNVYQALRSKKFSRLVIAPVNLASVQGVRYWRELPLCNTTTDANPVVPVVGATIPAGREFRNGAGRVRIAARTNFTAFSPIASGIAGTTVAGVAAATQVFNAVALFDWTTIVRPDGTLGAHKGDILVVGNNTAGAKSVDAGTYRVSTDPVSGVAITVESLGGVNFAFTGVVGTVPWRLHVSSDADSAPVRVPGSAAPGGYGAADIGGYSIPTRPLTNLTGASVDGLWTALTQLTPAVVPPATTGSSWDSLGGLGGRCQPTNGLSFTAAIQAVNAVAVAGLDVLYSTALTACDTEDLPARDVNIVWTARKSAANRSALKTHVLNASGHGGGRIAVLSPDLGVQTVAAAQADADPGVGANRDERVIYTWPGVRTFVAEAVNFRLKTADVNTTIDGVLDESFDSYYASVLSNLAPELNPGQAAPPIPNLLSPIVGIQRGVVGMGINEYTLLRSRGVSAVRIDRNVGPVIQSGITTVISQPAQKPVNRRRMADYIEDSLANGLISFCKLPVTNSFKDAVVGEVASFLDGLLSSGNAAAQRIAAYQVDDKSGNTKELLAQGIFVVIVRVTLLATGDFIVLQAEIGQTVNIVPLAA